MEKKLGPAAACRSQTATSYDATAIMQPT